MDDDTIAFGEEDEAQSGKLKHPYVTFFHLAFRVSALFAYLMGRWFFDSFITIFVVVILFLSMDFWTVKNISGRLMVGLRWWNYVDDDGKSHWVFESRKGPQQNRINSSESRIFWLALIICPLLWVFLFLSGLFGAKLQWLLLVCIALILNGSNLYCYVKCKMGKDKNISTATTDFLRQRVMQNVVSSMMTKSPSTTNPSQSSNVI